MTPVRNCEQRYGGESRLHLFDLRDINPIYGPRLANQIPVEVRAALGRRSLAPGAISRRPPDTNIVLGIKRANAAVAAHLGRGPDTRDEWTIDELRRVIDDLPDVVERAIAETFDAR